MFEIKNIWRWGPLLLLGLAIPVSVTAGTIGVGLVFLLAAVAWCIDRGRVVWPARTVLWSLAALVGAYLLATLLAMPFPHHWNKFAEELWIKMLLVAIPVLVARNPRLAVWALKAAILAGTIAAAFAVLQYFLGHDPLRDRSVYLHQFGHSAVSGFFGHHLSYGGQALIFIILTASWFAGSDSRRVRLWLAPVLLIMVLALLWNFARSAWLGTLAGLLVLLLIRPHRLRWPGLLTLGAAMVAALALAPVRTHFLRIFDLDQHVTRLNLWQSSWDGIKANVLLGFGPGNFDSLLAGYKVVGHYDNLAHAHNDVLMHGVNAGLPGMLSALALLGVTCWLLLRAARRAGSEYAWILRGAVAVQVGITVAGFFQVFQTDDEVEMLLYFVLGCAVALAGPVLHSADSVDTPAGKPGESV